MNLISTKRISMVKHRLTMH